jgi:photosystem II stability/assembly factor-like uncharacterized protein
MDEDGKNENAYAVGASGEAYCSCESGKTAVQKQGDTEDDFFLLFQ